MFRLTKFAFLILKRATLLHQDSFALLINFHLDSIYSCSQNKLFQLFIFEDPLQKYSIFPNIQQQDPSIIDEHYFGPFLSKVPMLQRFIFLKVKTKMVLFQKRRHNILEGQDFQVSHFLSFTINLCLTFYHYYLYCIIYRFFKISLQLFHCKGCNQILLLVETRD